MMAHYCGEHQADPAKSREHRERELLNLMHSPGGPGIIRILYLGTMGLSPLQGVPVTALGEDQVAERVAAIVAHEYRA